MAQTFDIRFARTPGLAALLEVPENRFRWKGGGLLRIDSRGISIGLKRGLLALLGGKRTQRIPSEDLRAVYREGEAVRVEYQSGSANVVLPFWADNRDAAAQIVRMLPTSQTVEIEHSTDVTHPGSRVPTGACCCRSLGRRCGHARGKLGARTSERSCRHRSEGAEEQARAADRPSDESPWAWKRFSAGRETTPASPSPPVTTPSARSAPERSEEPAFPLDTSRPAMAETQERRTVGDRRTRRKTAITSTCTEIRQRDGRVRSPMASCPTNWALPRLRWPGGSSSCSWPRCAGGMCDPVCRQRRVRPGIGRPAGHDTGRRASTAPIPHPVRDSMLERDHLMMARFRSTNWRERRGAEISRAPVRAAELRPRCPAPRPSRASARVLPPPSGCNATVLSHCCLVSPAFTATAASWIISGASSPAMCTPNNTPDSRPPPSS